MEWLKSPLIKTSGERYIDAIKELDNIFLKYKNDLETANKKVEFQNDRILELENKIDSLYKIIKNHSKFSESITPTQVYHNKKRGNTTVKFLDGSSVTVKLMKGDQDSIETAVVYALCKKIYTKKMLQLLVNNVKETGEEN